jgi:hypothetical protein
MRESAFHIEPLREDRSYIRLRVLEPRGSPSRSLSPDLMLHVSVSDEIATARCI